uniref:Uncharacterized protein n=1 Tax=Lygus hesperus TaxID=30085 RepID=A0A146KPJ4_LYGHE
MTTRFPLSILRAINGILRSVCVLQKHHSAVKQYRSDERVPVLYTGDGCFLSTTLYQSARIARRGLLYMCIDVHTMGFLLPTTLDVLYRVWVVSKSADAIGKALTNVQVQLTYRPDQKYTVRKLLTTNS